MKTATNAIQIRQYLMSPCILALTVVAIRQDERQEQAGPTKAIGFPSASLDLLAKFLDLIPQSFDLLTKFLHKPTQSFGFSMGSSFLHFSSEMLPGLLNFSFHRFCFFHEFTR